MQLRGKKEIWMAQAHALSAPKHVDAQSVSWTVSRGHAYGWGWLESRFMNPSPPMVFRMLSEAESADCLAASTLAFNLQPPPCCSWYRFKLRGNRVATHINLPAPHTRGAHIPSPPSPPS